jgi:hypothetical protein
MRVSVVPVWSSTRGGIRSCAGRAGLFQAVREFLFGMTGYEFAQHALAMRASLETLFMVITIGDIIGVPVIPPYYALRLLPYVTPHVTTWKRRVLREREMTDEHEYDLHGI